MSRAHRGPNPAIGVSCAFFIYCFLLWPGGINYFSKNKIISVIILSVLQIMGKQFNITKNKTNSQSKFNVIFLFFLLFNTIYICSSPTHIVQWYWFQLCVNTTIQLLQYNTYMHNIQKANKMAKPALQGVSKTILRHFLTFPSGICFLVLKNVP